MVDKTVYGYARISTKSQNIERQIRNILGVNPKAVIYEEAFTGTTLERPKFNTLLKRLEVGDTIIFDSVSRMSRNALEGFKLYEKLFEAGINIKFIKEPYIDTEVYNQQLENSNIGDTDNEVVNAVLEGVRNALKLLAKQQIEIAFGQSEKEVTDLQARTKEGLKTAKLSGKELGHNKKVLDVKKARIAKDYIAKHYNKFGGTDTSEKVLASLRGGVVKEFEGISRPTFFKYVKEIQEEITGGANESI